MKATAPRIVPVVAGSMAREAAEGDGPGLSPGEADGVGDGQGDGPKPPDQHVLALAQVAEMGGFARHGATPWVLLLVTAFKN